MNIGLYNFFYWIFHVSEMNTKKWDASGRSRLSVFQYSPYCLPRSWTRKHSHQQCMILFFTHFCQHSLFLFFLMYFILTGVKWYLIDLIWISLIIHDDEQIISSVLQAICLFTSKKCLFFSSPHFCGIIIKFSVIVLCECLFIFEY